MRVELYSCSDGFVCALFVLLSCTTQPCNNIQWHCGGVAPCTAASFGPCSATCGGGSQLREVTCRDSSKTLQPETYCPLNRPSNFQLCNTQPCPNSHIRGDPDFNGFLGQKYQVHGVPDGIFNIITSPNVQYNALFSFIPTASGRACDKTRTQPWTHTGTYLGQLGFKVGSARILMNSGSCLEGVKSVTVDGQEMTLGQTVELPAAVINGETVPQSVTWTETDRVQLNLAEVELVLENSDMFFNQRATITKRGWKLKQMHGLLGQTWRRTVNAAGKQGKIVQGSTFDYQEQQDDIFGDDFTFNKFPKH